MITPEEARARMPSARGRAAKTVADKIESFIEDGDEDAVIVLPLKARGDNAVIAELLAYKNAGWDVSFYRRCAALSLPEVVS